MNSKWRGEDQRLGNCVEYPIHVISSHEFLFRHTILLGKTPSQVSASLAAMTLSSEPPSSGNQAIRELSATKRRKITGDAMLPLPFSVLKQLKPFFNVADIAKLRLVNKAYYANFSDGFLARVGFVLSPFKPMSDSISLNEVQALSTTTRELHLIIDETDRYYREPFNWENLLTPGRLGYYNVYRRTHSAFEIFLKRLLILDIALPCHGRIPRRAKEAPSVSNNWDPDTVDGWASIPTNPSANFASVASNLTSLTITVQINHPDEAGPLAVLDSLPQWPHLQEFAMTSMQVDLVQFENFLDTAHGLRRLALMDMSLHSPPHLPPWFSPWPALLDALSVRLHRFVVVIEYCEATADEVFGHLESALNGVEVHPGKWHWLNEQNLAAGELDNDAESAWRERWLSG